MLTGFVSAGVQVKVPDVLTKVAPDGRSVLSVSETLSPSGSVTITVRELSSPTVTLKVLVTFIVGLSLAVSNNKQQLSITHAQLLHKMLLTLYAAKIHSHYTMVTTPPPPLHS